jgi:alpha-1,6-mannosyltransferase
VKKSGLIVGLTWLFAIVFLHQIGRSDFLTFWCIYTTAFITYFWLLFAGKRIDFKTGLVLAFVARIISLFFEPHLSDDYFRFIWDGMVSHSGIHPMAYTPLYLVQHPEIIQADMHLFSMLNSKAYYSVYPPVAQWIFSFSYWINGLHVGGHILFIKFLLIATDAVILFFLSRLLKHKSLPEHHALWYALNPLIILEYTGNLHMDGLMIAGLLGAVWLSQKKAVAWSIAAMVISISSKLLTLMLIPFMPRDMYWKKMIFFGTFSLFGAILLFKIYFGSHTAWTQSVSLWFSSFEFNASIYYLVRTLGFWMRGYNAIDTIGPMMALLSIIGIGVIWVRYIQRKIEDWSLAMLMVMTIYFFMSTTVHPWYLGLVLILGILSQRIYPVIWTFLVVLSYSHYASGRFEENYGLIITEYVLLCAWMVFEWRWRARTRMIYTRRAAV